MKRFVNGRQNVFKELRRAIAEDDQVIWLHAASLGEYEQGVPILKSIRQSFPQHKIVITFFSPSGYEVKKNNEFGHVTTYLPLDTKSNAKKFIEATHPVLALFVKYEIWPNYLQELSFNSTPALLISGNFRPEQIYFKSYGRFMKKALHTFEHLFVQNLAAQKLLQAQGFTNVTLSGDTRFDRVAKQLEMDNQLDFVEKFKGDKLCIVCGSTWPEDESLFIDYINTASDKVKFIIAPHQIQPRHIANFKNQLNKPTLLYSERQENNLSDFSVLIINTVGLLTKIYAYADIAYVGGAAGNTGLHNILEPAAFGLPIIIGKNFDKFSEAKALLKAKGLYTVATSNECANTLHKLIDNSHFRHKTGENSRQFVQKNKGATRIIMDYIKSYGV